MLQLLSNCFSLFPSFLGFCKNRGMWNLANQPKVIYSVGTEPDTDFWGFVSLLCQGKLIQNENSLGGESRAPALGADSLPTHLQSAHCYTLSLQYAMNLNLVDRATAGVVGLNILLILQSISVEQQIWKHRTENQTFSTTRKFFEIGMVSATNLWLISDSQEMKK